MFYVLGLLMKKLFCLLCMTAGPIFGGMIDTNEIHETFKQISDKAKQALEQCKNSTSQKEFKERFTKAQEQAVEEIANNPLLRIFFVEMAMFEKDMSSFELMILKEFQEYNEPQKLESQAQNQDDSQTPINPATT